jgi:hypothetical protein
MRKFDQQAPFPPMNLEQAIRDLRDSSVLMARAENYRASIQPFERHHEQAILRNLQRIERNLAEIRVKFERLMRPPA